MAKKREQSKKAREKKKAQLEELTKSETTARRNERMYKKEAFILHKRKKIDQEIYEREWARMKPGANPDEIQNSKHKFLLWFEEAVKKKVELDTGSLVSAMIKAGEEWLKGEKDDIEYEFPWF